MRTAGFGSKSRVKNKLQAALYHNRKRRLARQIPSASYTLAATHDFTSALPAEYTYTRNDTAATYRDSNGDYQQSTANSPRFDHTPTGLPLGLKFEDARTNKNTNYNFSPTDTTGLTYSGGSGTVTVVDKTATLATLGLDKVGNGKMYKCEAVGGTLTVYIDGTPGNTNTHSFRLYGWSEGGFVAVDLTGAGSTTMPFGEANFAEIKSENLTPTHSSRKIRINIASGRTVYFVGNGLEEAAFLSSPIVVEGAAATRQRDVCYNNAVDEEEWFDLANGAVVCDYRVDGAARDTAMYPFMLSKTTGFTDTIGGQLTAGRAKVSARIRANNTEYVGNDVGGYVTDRDQFMAISWENGVSATVVTNGGAYTTDDLGEEITAVDRLQIGGRAFTEALWGHVKTLKFYTGSEPTKTIMGATHFTAADFIYPIGGQSNGWAYESAQSGSNSSGLTAMVDTTDIYFTEVRNVVANGATPATTAVYYSATSSDINWWYDVDTGEFGVPMQRWEEVMSTVAEGTYKFAMWDQGESDAGGDEARYKIALEAIFARMREVTGNSHLPIIIIPIGQKDTLAADGYQTIREVQWQIADEQANTHLAPEKFVQPMVDELHFTEAGMVNNAPLPIRKGMSVIGETVTGGVDGAEVASVSRTGMVYTITLAHDEGTDFGPSTGIEGFEILDDGVALTLSSVVHTTSTIITATASTTPTGIETFYYGFGAMDNIDEANLVVDNDAIPLPLRSCKFVTTTAGGAFNKVLT